MMIASQQSPPSTFVLPSVPPAPRARATPRRVRVEMELSGQRRVVGGGRRGEEERPRGGHR